MKPSMTLQVVALFGGLSLAGCGQPRAANPDQQAGSAPQALAASANFAHPGPGGPGPGGPGPDAQAKALRACLNAWPDQPFGPNKTTADRVLQPSVTVFGHGKALDDEEVTSGPSLTLIPSAVNVLGDVEYDLLNPNGWYCLVSSVDVFSNVRIYLKQSARLNEAHVTVGVGRRGDDPGDVSVGIGAHTRVITVQ